MSNRLSTVVNELVTGLDFVNDELEVLVEKAFIAGATAMDALYKIEGVDPDANLDDYVAGIAGITQGAGTFVGSLTEEQEATYRTNLKKVITHPDANVEAALEAFADANLDLTAAVINVNNSVNTPPAE